MANRGSLACRVQNVSVVMPVRKKLTLEIYGSGRGGSNKLGGLAIITPAKGEAPAVTETEIEWKDVGTFYIHPPLTFPG